MPTISLLDLPVEILYYICDNLDTLHTLRSFRHVCKHLYAVINNYNRFKLNIESTSKAEMIFISHLIQPESITSLVFSSQYLNTEQLDLFRSIFNTCRLIRLHSLTLCRTKDSDIQYFFEHIRFFRV